MKDESWWCRDIKVCGEGQQDNWFDNNIWITKSSYNKLHKEEKILVYSNAFGASRPANNTISKVESVFG